MQYLCTVSDPSGQSATLWRGTAFDCTGNQAALFHVQYTSGLAVDACDNGNFTLTAQGLANVTDDCYTSMLTVNIVPGLNGRTVECTFVGTTIVGSDTLQVAGIIILLKVEVNCICSVSPCSATTHSLNSSSGGPSP